MVAMDPIPVTDKVLQVQHEEPEDARLLEERRLAFWQRLTSLDRWIFTKAPDTIELRNVNLHNAPYRASPPLRFKVRYDPRDELYDLDGEFGISVSASSRSDLDRGASGGVVHAVDRVRRGVAGQALAEGATPAH